MKKSTLHIKEMIITFFNAVFECYFANNIREKQYFLVKFLVYRNRRINNGI